jgi:hypothetical protein
VLSLKRASRGRERVPTVRGYLPRFNFTTNHEPSQQNLVETIKVNNLTERPGLLGAQLEKETLPQMQVIMIQRTEQIWN